MPTTTRERETKRLTIKGKVGDTPVIKLISDHLIGELMITIVGGQRVKMFLDLEKTHPAVARALVEWLAAVNRPRIDAGDPVMITYQLIKQFPAFPRLVFRFEPLNAETLL